MLSLTPTASSGSPVNLTCVSLDCGRKLGSRSPYAWGEHANSTQKSQAKQLVIVQDINT